MESVDLLSDSELKTLNKIIDLCKLLEIDNISRIRKAVKRVFKDYLKIERSMIRALLTKRGDRGK